MNADLQNARAYMEDKSCTCVLCRGETLFSSRHRGVRPLLDFLDSGRDFRGFSAADKVVGRATAFLYCLLGVRELYAHVLSDGAAEVLRSQGILFFCESRVPGIRNRAGDGPCPMEKATMNITDSEEALAAIREALKRLGEPKSNS